MYPFLYEATLSQAVQVSYNSQQMRIHFLKKGTIRLPYSR